jgi:hypothetical protein
LRFAHRAAAAFFALARRCAGVNACTVLGLTTPLLRRGATRRLLRAGANADADGAVGGYLDNDLGEVERREHLLDRAL